MAKRNKAPVAEICLYGVRSTGAGWILATREGVLRGDGEPRADRTFSAAIAEAFEALAALGLRGEPVLLVDAGGERSARLIAPVAYGDVLWAPAAPGLAIEVRA